MTRSRGRRRCAVHTYLLGHASPMSPRPTTLTRGYNGSATSVTSFVYALARLI
jgi:hypothetical protein